MKEKLIGGLICGRESEKRYILEYHYLGEPKIFKSEFVCRTMLNAINLTLESENWRPIVFDTFIIEDNK